MTKRNPSWAAAPLALLAAALLTHPVPLMAQGPTIEPEATQLLKRMTDYLGGLEKFSVDTDNMLEDVLVTGQKIQYDFTATVHIRRPDRLLAEQAGDLLQQVLVYDGRSLTIYNSKEQYFATTGAPDNLDDLLQLLLPVFNNLNVAGTIDQVTHSVGTNL